MTLSSSDTTKFTAEFQRRLISWYHQHGRDLPWRVTTDPYAIWVSEIMLQQTQVKNVVPYYQRFMTSFPTVETLASADLHQVLKLWEGLGYYARARNLHKAAKVIASIHQGCFPTHVDDLRSLPGIGEYTAAAISSMAYQADMPAVDGNVNRVLSRIFMIDVDPKLSRGKRIFREKAESLLAAGQAGTFNQAMMEIGAIICMPRAPKCSTCPVSVFCQARQQNVQLDYPVKSLKRQRPHKTVAVGIVFKADKILIDQRNPDAMLGGLWEFPGGHVQDDERCEEAVIREVKEELGVEVEVLSHLATVEHQYTHFTVSLHAFVCRFLSGTPKAIGCNDWKWVAAGELSDYAFPRANGKLIEILLKTPLPNKIRGAEAMGE